MRFKLNVKMLVTQYFEHPISQINSIREYTYLLGQGAGRVAYICAADIHGR